jgi:glucose/mannose-6-phosphate isomerase
VRSLVLREDLLDEPDQLDAADPDGMLRAVMGAPAQFREAVTTATEAGWDDVADAGRPRALLVAGMGGSGIAGDVLGAVAGPHAPVPVTTYRGYGLPGWVGPADVVVAVSCSGRTEETLSAAEEAVRRGARIVTVGLADSPLADLGARGRGVHVPVPGGRMPRASLWALSVPLFVLADRLGVVRLGAGDLDAAGDLLDELTERYKPAKETFLNTAKALALSFAEPLPVIWGTSPLARRTGWLANSTRTPSAPPPGACCRRRATTRSSRSTTRRRRTGSGCCSCATATSTPRSPGESPSRSS